MNSKIDRAADGPSWTEVTFGALLGILIGALLAAVWLVQKPVQTVRELPKEPVAGVIYYIEGSANSSMGAAWMRKRQLFVAGSSISVSEHELNTAARNLSSNGGNKTDGKEAGMVTPGPLNFRIADGELQIASKVDVALLGLQSALQVVARGEFVRRGDHFAFEPNQVYVGSCRVDRLPVIGGMILRKVTQAMVLPEDLNAAWSKVDAVTIDGAEMQLVMR